MSRKKRIGDNQKQTKKMDEWEKLHHTQLDKESQDMVTQFMMELEQKNNVFYLCHIQQLSKNFSTFYELNRHGPFEVVMDAEEYKDLNGVYNSSKEIEEKSKLLLRQEKLNQPFLKLWCVCCQTRQQVEMTEEVKTKIDKDFWQYNGNCPNCNNNDNDKIKQITNSEYTVQYKWKSIYVDLSHASIYTSSGGRMSECFDLGKIIFLNQNQKKKSENYFVSQYKYSLKHFFLNPLFNNDVLNIVIEYCTN